jgi:hypothetical protein
MGHPKSLQLGENHADQCSNLQFLRLLEKGKSLEQINDVWKKRI